MRHRLCSLSANIIAGWKRVAKASDEAARAELLSGSKLDDVTKREVAAQAQADRARKAREDFDHGYAELEKIPTRLENLYLRLSQIGVSRQEINNAEQGFRELYAATLRGARVQSDVLPTLAGVISTKDIRLTALAEVETEINAEVGRLEARSKELRKLLGIK